jgi:hypothetical protein
MNKSQKYHRQMVDLNLRELRIWIPAALDGWYRERAALDRLDYLQALVEDAPDGDMRLEVLAGMNRATALTPTDRARILSAARDPDKARAALEDLDNLDAVIAAALRAAHVAETGPTPGTATRHYARATVAAMDYRRQRDLLFQKG